MLRSSFMLRAAHTPKSTCVINPSYRCQSSTSHWSQLRAKIAVCTQLTGSRPHFLLSCSFNVHDLCPPAKPLEDPVPIMEALIPKNRARIQQMEAENRWKLLDLQVSISSRIVLRRRRVRVPSHYVPRNSLNM